MLSLLGQLPHYWMDGTIRSLEGLRRGLSNAYPLNEDPPPVTPSEVVYEGGKVRLRHYYATAISRSIPLLLVYSLIKRPFVLDLLKGRSVIETLTKQGFDVYLIDWLPPSRSDSWRGFNAYVNGDLANAVRAIQIREEIEQVSILGYCFGGVLASIYTALHPESVKNLITLAMPFDMRTQETTMNALLANLNPETLNRIATVYGNCPAWLIKAAFESTAPVHHLLDKYVGLYRNREREGYEEMFVLFERWMNSDVPMAGQIFRESTEDLFRHNRFMRNRLQVGSQTVTLNAISCPVLNIVGEHDDVVPPQSSVPFVDSVGSQDAHTLLFPSGHMGLAVGGAAHWKLWPQVGTWLKERCQQF